MLTPPSEPHRFRTAAIRRIQLCLTCGGWPELSVALATLAGMDQLAERSRRGWPTRVLRRFAAPATQTQKLDQSAAQRARVDTSAWTSRAPIRFGLLTTCAVAGAGFLGAVLATALPLAAQVAVAIGAACVGFAAPVGVLFAIKWVAAFPHQRNEARDEVRRLTQPTDRGDGEPQNRDLFAAHNPSLLPELDTWHTAINRVETVVQNLRDWIPQEVQRRGFTEPDYFDGTVAECFSEVTVGRARRHELGDPHKTQLRCVQDVTVEDGENRWSAYLHSGRAEIKGRRPEPRGQAVF
jgi:hypothetical protein